MIGPDGKLDKKAVSIDGKIRDKVLTLIPSGIQDELSVVYLDEVASTNSFLKEQLKTRSTGKRFSLVIARNQMQGRGAGDRSWYQVPGKDIAFSFGVAGKLGQGEALATGILVSVIIAKVLEDCLAHRFSFKWPNDLVEENRKVAGVLIERGHGYTVAGIGVNLNSRSEDFPVELRHRLVTVREVAGREIDPAPIIAGLAAELVKMSRGETIADDLLSTWHQRNRSVGRNVLVQMPEGFIKGVVKEVRDKTFALIVEDAIGNRHTIVSSWGLRWL